MAKKLFEQAQRTNSVDGSNRVAYDYMKSKGFVSEGTMKISERFCRPVK